MNLLRSLVKPLAKKWIRERALRLPLDKREIIVKSLSADATIQSLLRTAIIMTESALQEKAVTEVERL